MPSRRKEVASVPVDAERLRINVLGSFSIARGAEPLKLVGRKAQGMLGYLVLSDSPEVTRERLVGLLWSESDEQQARGSLRHSLHEVQTALRLAGLTDLRAEKLTLGLDRSNLYVDLWDVLAKLKSGQTHPLLLERTRITDSILAGLDGIDPAFGLWLTETRQSIHARLVGGLERSLPAPDQMVVAAEAETAARALALLDPAHEAAARTIIRARWAAGDIGTALRTYDELWKHLDQEFDTEPSPETQNLIAELRLAQPETTALPSTQLAEDRLGVAVPGGYEARPSIAVLPFRTLGAPDQQYFGDGIVDDIIQALAGLKDLFVIAKGSTRKYRDAAPDVKAIGKDLGVRYILHGSVQRSGEQLRIHTMLADTETAEIVRPSRYDGRLADLFDLQDQIALETTKVIAPYVRERELKRAMRKHPQSLTAYDLVLQALGPLHDLDYTSFSRARGLLYRAVEIDPTYAPAFSSLAHWHCYRIGQLWSTDIQADAGEAERLAEVATRLDSHNATALAVHAHVKCIAHRDYEASRAGFERALAASPNSAFAWTMSAITESCAGRGADGILHALTALKLSPADNFSHYTYGVLAQSHFVSGNYSEAVKYGRSALERNNRFAANLRILAASLVEVGQLEAARQVAAQHLRLVPKFSLHTWSERTWLSDPARDKVVRNLRRVGMPE
jgi:TolB-like protein